MKPSRAAATGEEFCRSTLDAVRLAGRRWRFGKWEAAAAALQTQDLHEDVDFAGPPQAETPAAPRKGKGRRRGEEA